MIRTTLLPCPLCGATFLMGQEPLDNHPVGGMFYIFHDYGSLGSAARACPLEVPRHFNSVEEAVSAWNTRGRGVVRELEQRIGTVLAAINTGGSETDDDYASLSRLIGSRLLGVKPDEQDLELDDHDWMMIIDALSHKALVLAEQQGAST